MPNFLAIGGNILVSSVCFAIAFFVIYKNFQPKGNKWFVTFNLCIGLWCLCPILINIIPSYSVSLTIQRICYIFAVLLISVFYEFVMTMTDVKLNPKIRYLELSLTGILLIFLPTPLFIKGLATVKGTTLLQSSPGTIYYVFFLHFAIGCGAGLYMLFDSMKRFSAYRKNQIKFLFIGYGIAYFGGAIYFSTIFRILNIFTPAGYIVSVGIFVLFYAIIKHRLMDINLVIRDGVAYSLASLLITGVFAGVSYIFVSSPIVIILFLLLGLISPFLHPLLKSKLLPVVEKTFFKDRYAYLKEINKYRDLFRDTSITVKDVAENLVGLAVKIFDPEQANFLSYQYDDKTYRIKFQLGMDDPSAEIILQLSEQSPLIVKLSEQMKILVKENEDKSVVEEMDKLQAEVSIPLLMLGKVVGILNLGPKQNKEMYHYEDISTLSSICRMAEEVLRTAIVSEQESVLTAGMAHDLRSPFNKIFPAYLDPLADGELGELNDQQKEAVETVREELAKLKERLGITLDRTSLLYKRLYPEQFSRPFAINEVIDYVAKLFSKQTEQKHLQIELRVSDNLPLIFADPDDIELGVLQNLVSNALRHTQQGKIIIGGEIKNNEFVGSVSDTGSGISKEDLENIFEPFKQGEGLKGEKGLGLFRVKDIITTYGGKVWIESELGKGSSFFFSLPLATDEQIEKLENQSGNLV